MKRVLQITQHSFRMEHHLVCWLIYDNFVKK